MTDPPVAPAAPTDQKDDLPPKGAIVVLLISVALSLALPHVPFGRWVWWPLMLVSTLVHELGHGIAAVLTGGDFIRFEMFANGSGVAMTRGGIRALVSAGGLVGPAFGACALFFMARTEKRARIALGVVAVLLLVALALVVRNLFGVFFVASLAAVLLLIVKFGNAWAARFGLVFLAVQLALSVFSRGDYLFTDVAKTSAGNMPSDVAQMADALLLPYWFWGGLCGLISVAVLALGLRLYLRPQ